MEMSEIWPKADELRAVCSKPNMMDEVRPTQVDVDHAVVSDAIVLCRSRPIQCVMQLIDPGDHAQKKIEMLTGFRPLDAEREKESVLVDKRFVCDGGESILSSTSDIVQTWLSMWPAGGRIDASPGCFLISFENKPN